METTRAKDIIVQILQGALANRIKPGETVNPRAIADAIATMVEFEKSPSNVKADKIIGTLQDAIINLKGDASSELDKLSNHHEDEKMLANFVHGKFAAYNEMLDVIKSL